MTNTTYTKFPGRDRDLCSSWTRIAIGASSGMTTHGDAKFRRVALIEQSERDGAEWRILRSVCSRPIGQVHMH